MGGEGILGQFSPEFYCRRWQFGRILRRFAPAVLLSGWQPDKINDVTVLGNWIFLALGVLLFRARQPNCIHEREQFMLEKVSATCKKKCLKLFCSHSLGSCLFELAHVERRITFDIKIRLTKTNLCWKSQPAWQNFFISNVYKMLQNCTAQRGCKKVDCQWSGWRSTVALFPVFNPHHEHMQPHNSPNERVDSRKLSGFDRSVRREEDKSFQLDKRVEPRSFYHRPEFVTRRLPFPTRNLQWFHHKMLFSGDILLSSLSFLFPSTFSSTLGGAQSKWYDNMWQHETSRDRRTRTKGRKGNRLLYLTEFLITA